MWNIIAEVAKKHWRKQGKDPYVEWAKFERKENIRARHNFQQRTRQQSLRNL
jgi:hypothetical protein